MRVTRKTEIQPINGTPFKRVFWSIISDYNLRTGICELVDNALDIWTNRADKKHPLRIVLALDPRRQLISVTDNAGGVKEEELQLLIAPGGSQSDPNAEMIGIFGVGSKRAGVALGEQVDIRTRYKNEQSFELNITKQWLGSDEWELPAYEIPDIEPGTTQVDISQLRKPFLQEDVDAIRVHLGEVYDWFLQQGCVLELNNVNVAPKSFEDWAYPSRFSPRRAIFDAQIGPGGPMHFELTGGLIRDRNPETENYGAYFYCNHRLIVKELKIREVGYYVTAEAGVPHPDASLCRVIVRLQGPARQMPWNSSKSGINFGEPAVQVLRPTLIQLVSHFSSLSRRLKGDWDGKVFSYKRGQIDDIEPADITVKNPLVLPDLPTVRKRRIEKLKSRNRSLIRSQPWTLGLVEAMGAVDIISRQRFETKNRIALILLDSNFEIALKEFIVHREDLFPRSQFGDAAIQRLFKNRLDVISTVIAKVSIAAKLIDKARHYYGLRNKLIHERATVDVADSDVDNYRETTEKILTILFRLRFPR